MLLFAWNMEVLWNFALFLSPKSAKVEVPKMEAFRYTYYSKNCSNREYKKGSVCGIVAFRMGIGMHGTVAIWLN